MSQIPPPPPPSANSATRTIRRIIAETVFVGLAGALAWGLAWELGHDDIGWVLAIVIWILGDPILEISRMMQSRKHISSPE